MGPNYTLTDLNVPFSEAARLLGVTKKRLLDCCHLGLIDVSMGHPEIYGAVFHMSEIINYLTCTCLAAESLPVDLHEEILTTLEIEGAGLAGERFGDGSYVECIHYALERGPEPLANALSYHGFRLQPSRVRRLHRRLHRDFRKVIGKVLWAESNTALRIAISNHTVKNTKSANFDASFLAPIKQEGQEASQNTSTTGRWSWESIAA